MTKEKKILVGIISLGCDKNRVDTENMLSYLRDGGYEFTSDPARADVIIINTCAFIQAARKEATDTISEMLNFKKTGICKKLVVTGCMPQRYLRELQNDFPEIDVFLGINDYRNIVKVLNSAFKIKNKTHNRSIVSIGEEDSLDCVEKGRLITTPTHYTYLKIADGCDNFCSYCTIPFIRGRYRSRKIESLVAEATDLVSKGIKEIILIAQDITKYGIDMYKRPMLVELIRKLSKIEGLTWIRLLYCYPESVTDELLNEIVVNDKVCKYMDIPFQHVASSVLKRMNRKIDKQGIIDLVQKIKKLPKFIAIRTTFMLGFPGETHAEFKELLAFIKKYQLTHVGFFDFSKEEGTAAFSLPNQIDDKIKQKRLLKAAKLQKRIALNNNRKLIGKTLKVCYEGTDYDKKLFFGRSEYQSPEIDTLVYFRSNTPTEVGAFYNIKIKKILNYDLKGEKTDELTK